MYIIKNNSFIKKHFRLKKTVFFYGKTPAQWVKWVYTRVHTQANPAYEEFNIFLIAMHLSHVYLEGPN